MQITKKGIREAGFVKTMRIIERQVLMLALDKSLSISKNAKLLGVHRSRLTMLVKGYDIDNAPGYRMFYSRKENEKC